jgi:hypothetical protein
LRGQEIEEMKDAQTKSDKPVDPPK